MRKRLFAVLLSAAVLIGSAHGLQCRSVSAEQIEITDESVEVQNRAPSQPVNESGELAANAQSAILMELETGKVLFEKNPDEQREPASITKVMTMALVLEQIDQGKLAYEDMVTASENAKNMGGTQINLDVGEQMSVYDLLMSVAVASANDSSVALGEHLAGGSENAFVDMMNKKAKKLGMDNTHFVNPNGLPADGHVTTARDIAVMSRYLLSFEKAAEFIATDRYPVRSGENEYMMRNSNALVREYDGCVGVKTGYTSTAGHCLSAAAKRGDMTLIAVVLGEPDSKTRFAEAKALLDHGFDTYALFQPQVEVKAAAPIPVKKGLQSSVEVVTPSKKIPPQLVKRGEEPRIEEEFQLDKSLDAPVVKGQKVGSLVVKIEGEVIYQENYIVKRPVKQRTFWYAIGILLKNMIVL